MQSISIIGGTGMKKLLDSPFLEGSGIELIANNGFIVETDFGEVPVDRLTMGTKEGKFGLTFIHRHHGEDGKTTPPHKVNYRANVSAAAAASPEFVLTIHSVGTLIEGLPPGSLGLAADIIDFTGIVSTFHDDDAVHFDISNHFRPTLRTQLHPLITQSQSGISFGKGGQVVEHIVAQMPGPQFETVAEIEALFRLGATTVGMTLSPEARLVCEKKLGQVALLVASNWAVGRHPDGPDIKVDHESVEAQAERLHKLIWQSITTLINGCI
jgi:5'-methylthioadenosine phosphorylase